MKKLLISALVLSSAANGQVIECPTHFPRGAVPLPEARSSREGGARLFPARLSSASIQVGEQYGQPVEVPPSARKVKDGWETGFHFTPQETKWLVCRYGGDGKGFAGGAIDENVEWWSKIDQRATSCLLQVKETRHAHAASNWSAAAMCR